MKSAGPLAVVVAVTFSVGALLPVCSNASDKRDCYRTDADGDGYAPAGAESESVSVRISEKLNCPSGFVRLRGDTDDGNRSIHPRRAEAAGNGIDDDSDGRTDEAEFVYPKETDRGWVTTRSFRMKAIINDRRVWEASPSPVVEVEVVKLAESRPARTERIPTIEWPIERSVRYVVFEVPGCEQATVYRARLRFRDAESDRVLGGWSDWYYTTTAGSGDDEGRRTAILLRAFWEYNESELGRVGYRGTVSVDGTRYGARAKELWCSEFYAYVTAPYLQGVSNESTVRQLARFFGQSNSYHGRNEIGTVARRGDYLAVDNEEGKKEHSAMFLAYDRSYTPPRIWSIEGNLGNKVGIKDDRSPGQLDGFGHISGSVRLSNEQACREWCDSHSECAKCSTERYCGLGYEQLHSFTGEGTNWHACKEKARSVDNHAACEEYCRTHSGCAKCSRTLNCGVGFERMESFTRGGTNWYACREKARSVDNHAQCQEWCAAHPECVKCDTKIGCGVGYRRLRSWTGRGTNWHACRRR